MATEGLAIAGPSAGGLLAALVGVTTAHPDPEGEVGDHLQKSSEVHAVVSFLGASNLESILRQSTPFGLGIRISALLLLFRGQPDENPTLARLASPVAHVDANDPPLLLIHGDQDPEMPVNQSLELQGAYEEVSLSVQFVPIFGDFHGGKEFFAENRLALGERFLATALHPPGTGTWLN